MSDPLLLLTAHGLTPDELDQVLREVGATVDPDEVFDGRLSRDDLHIWVRLDNPELGFLPESTLQAAAAALGDQPRSSVVVEVSRKPGSEALVTDLAAALARRWPTLISDFRDRLLTPQAALELIRAGSSLRR
jgi:hypothetical protein